MSGAAAFAVTWIAYSAGHQAGDYWLQADSWAQGKGRPGREGRMACLGHVAAYTVTLAAFLALAAGFLGVPVSPWRAATGLVAVSGVTHYVADRRSPLRALAVAMGKGAWWDQGGAALLDQAWHLVWIFAAALVTAA